MIKFFRRIRKRLLKDNKFSKYLLYAIGEIVLVVMGILIALQINDWNQQRLDKKLEGQVLQRFVVDLERDLHNIVEARKNNEQRLIMAKSAIDLIKGYPDTVLVKREEYKTAVTHQSPFSDWLPVTFGERLFNILVFQTFTTSKASFDELKSTGKLDIVSNTDLKIAIQEYYPRMEDFLKFQDGVFLSVQMNFREALTSNGISSLNRSSEEELIPQLIEPKLLEVSLENYALITCATLRILSSGEGSLEGETKRLINQIKQEL